MPGSVYDEGAEPSEVERSVQGRIQSIIDLVVPAIERVELLGPPEVDVTCSHLRTALADVGRLVTRIRVEEQWDRDFETYRETLQHAIRTRAQFAAAGKAAIAAVPRGRQQRRLRRAI